MSATCLLSLRSVYNSGAAIRHRYKNNHYYIAVQSDTYWYITHGFIERDNIAGKWGGASGREGFSPVTSLQRVADRPKARHGCQLYCSAAAGGTQGLYCMSSSSTAGAQARPSLRHNRPQDVRYARAARQREPDLLPASNWEWTSNWLVLPGARFTPVAPVRAYDDTAVSVHMQW